MQLSLLLQARGIADLLLPTAPLCAASSSCSFSSRAWFTTKSLCSGLDRGAALFSSAYWITTWSFATWFQHPWKTQNRADFCNSICRAVFHPALFSHAPIQKFGFDTTVRTDLWNSIWESRSQMCYLPVKITSWEESSTEHSHHFGGPRWNHI